MEDWVAKSISLLINLRAASLKVTSGEKNKKNQLLILIPRKQELVFHKSTLPCSVARPFTYKENSQFLTLVRYPPFFSIN